MGKFVREAARTALDIREVGVWVGVRRRGQVGAIKISWAGASRRHTEINDVTCAVIKRCDLAVRWVRTVHAAADVARSVVESG